MALARARGFAGILLGTEQAPNADEDIDKNELGIIFEYTAPGTPQQNGVVERAFVTVMGRA